MVCPGPALAQPQRALDVGLCGVLSCMGGTGRCVCVRGVIIRICVPWATGTGEPETSHPPMTPAQVSLLLWGWGA